MSETYLGAFGLKAAPFSKEIADGDLWLPSSKAGVVRVPAQGDRGFRSKPITDSGPCRSPIPEQADR